MRHRVNLMVIPNRHLETPQHEIIRLRHDQLNQEGSSLASYEMAVKPAEEESDPTAAGETRAARPEAAVKGITPDHPAPTVAPKEPAAPPPVPGLFARIMSWLTGGGKKEEAVEEATKKPARSGRREKSDGERGGRGRREGRDRNERGERSDRGDRGDRSEQRRDRGDVAAKEPRENREGRQGRKERSERGNDNRRDNRDNRGSEAQEATVRPDNRQNRQKPANEADVQAQAIVGNPAPAEGNATEGTGEGGRRRGRRGGRNRGERQLDEISAAVAAVNAEATESAAPMSVATETVPATVAIPLLAEAGPVESQAAVPPALTFETPVEAVAPVEIPAITETPVAAVATVEEIQPVPANAPPVVVPEPPAAVVSAVLTPATTAAQVTAPVEPIDLSVELQKAGLHLIETSGAAPAPVVQAPVQPLGRKPKPTAVISNEPLQMVETQNHN